MSTDLDTEIRQVDVREGRSARAAEGSRYPFAAVSVGSIWLALAVASIWSPELVSGSDQTAIPIAGFTDWFYAVIATGLVLMAFSRRTPDLGRSAWGAFTFAISTIWLCVAVISIWTPELVSGTDPTHVPLGALVSPIAGVLATAFASVFVAGGGGGQVRAA